MAICQVMIMDFREGIGRYNEHGDQLYSDRDLDEWLAYITGHEKEGHVVDPFHGYDLKAAREWACLRLAGVPSPVTDEETAAQGYTSEPPSRRRRTRGSAAN